MVSVIWKSSHAYQRQLSTEKAVNFKWQCWTYWNVSWKQAYQNSRWDRGGKLLGKLTKGIVWFCMTIPPCHEGPPKTIQVKNMETHTLCSKSFILWFSYVRCHEKKTLRSDNITPMKKSKKCENSYRTLNSKFWKKKNRKPRATLW